MSWEIVSLITRNAKMAAAQNQAAAVDLEARLPVGSAQPSNGCGSEGRERSAKTFNTIKRALDLGYATMVEMAATQASLQKVHQQVLGIEQQQERERLALNQALGLPPYQHLPVATPGDSQPSRPLPALTELMEGIQERRLDLLALKMGYESQEEKLRAAFLAQVPIVSIGFSHASDTTHVITSGFSKAIDLPIFDRNQGKLPLGTPPGSNFLTNIPAVFSRPGPTSPNFWPIWRLIRKQISSMEQSIPTLKNLVQTYYRAVLEGNADVLTYYKAWDDLIAKELDLLHLKLNLADHKIVLEIAAGAYLGGDDYSKEVTRPDPESGTLCTCWRLLRVS